MRHWAEVSAAPRSAQALLTRWPQQLLVVIKTLYTSPLPEVVGATIHCNKREAEKRNRKHSHSYSGKHHTGARRIHRVRTAPSVPRRLTRIHCEWVALQPIHCERSRSLLLGLWRSPPSNTANVCPRERARHLGPRSAHGTALRRFCARCLLSLVYRD